MLIDHPEIHEQVRRQHVELQVGPLDVERGRIAHPLQDRVGQRTGAEFFRHHEFLRHARGGVGQRHQPRARALVQRLDQRLDLVLEHAGHQPLAAFLVHLVQRKDRHLDRHAVARVAGFVQVGRQAIDAAQAQRLGKRLRGDAGRLVAHQLVLRQQQQVRLLLDLGLEPAFKAGAGADAGGQLLVVKSVDQLLINQHVLPARLVLQVLDMGNHFFVGGQKGQFGVPVAGYQRLADEDFARCDRIDPAEVGAPAVVHHQPVQRGALQRRDLRGFFLPVRVEQLLP